MFTTKKKLCFSLSFQAKMVLTFDLSEGFLDICQTFIDSSGFFKQVFPHLVNIFIQLQFILSDLRICTNTDLKTQNPGPCAFFEEQLITVPTYLHLVHGQCPVSLLYIDVSHLHLQRHVSDVCDRAKNGLQIIKCGRALFQLCREVLW